MKFGCKIVKTNDLKGDIPMSRSTIGLEYSLLDGGVAVLVGIGYCDKENIVVPSNISGFPIVGVAEKAFSKVSQLKSITFPKPYFPISSLTSGENV